MSLLFLGLDPRPLSVAPFESGLEALATVGIDPAEFGLPPAVKAVLLPGIGGFVGGDTLAGLLACGLEHGPRPALFLDAGTNGEIVLAPRRGPMLAASTAAGPAFEGGHLSCGGPASPGAIDGARVGKDGTVTLGVKGPGPARWFCGSGVLGLVASMLDAGALSEDGRLNPSFPGVGKVDGMAQLRLGGAGDRLRFTQADVREVQLAVGAIRAGWRMLTDRAGVDAGNLKRVVVTGSFGRALDTGAARRLGLLPSGGPRPEALGSGAVRGLLRASAGFEVRAAWESLARRVVHIPLGSEAFQGVFLESLALRQHP